MLNTRYKAVVDHKPLVGEIKKKNSPSRLMRFKLALSEYDVETLSGGVGCVLSIAP